MTEDQLNRIKVKYSFLQEDYNYEVLTQQKRSIKNPQFDYTFVIYLHQINLRQITFIHRSPRSFPSNVQLQNIYIHRLKTPTFNLHFEDIFDCLSFHELRVLEGSKVKDFSEAHELIKRVSTILEGRHWPNKTSLNKLYQSTQKTRSRENPLIKTTKNGLVKLAEMGFSLSFDEGDLPIYEQSFMGPSLTYFHDQKEQKLRINIETRELSLIASLHDTNIPLNGKNIESACESIIQFIANSHKLSQ